MSTLQVKTMADFMAEGKQPDNLFWVGSEGSFDERAKKITKAYDKILNVAKINFGVCTIALAIATAAVLATALAIALVWGRK